MPGDAKSWAEYRCHTTSCLLSTSRPTNSLTPTVDHVAVKPIRLMGAHEIRIRLGGVSRQRAYQITSRADFPKPVADLAQGKVWLADDVEAWMKVHRHNLDDSED